MQAKFVKGGKGGKKRIHCQESKEEKKKKSACVRQRILLLSLDERPDSDE